MGDVLERYAITFDLWAETCDLLRAEGLNPDTDDGRNPRIADYCQLSRLLAQQLAEMGLKPHKASKERTREKQVAQSGSVQPGGIVYRIG